MEKVRHYGSKGVDFVVLEKRPSLQEGAGESLYSSVELKDCAIPPRNPPQLISLLLTSARTIRGKARGRPVAIYAYNQDIENVAVGLVFKFMFRAPLVVIYHQLRRSSYDSFGRGISRRRREGYNIVSAVWRSILPAFARYSTRQSDVNIALSGSARNEVREVLGIADCSVIGNGLDTEKFRQLPVPKSYDAVFLGRLSHQKGVDILLQAWVRVVDVKKDAKLLIVGGGEKSHVAEYKKMLGQLNLTGSVTMTGFVDDQELVSLLNSAHLFVFPSRSEGFAQAVSQAMGCELCCLLSDIPSLTEIYGEAATFFPSENAEELAKRILLLLGNERERQELGTKARRLAEGFSWDETVSKELVAMASGRTGSRETS